jgi:hypothetical protein
MSTWDRKQFENDGFSVSKGQVPGYTFVHACGFNPDIDQFQDETVWQAGGLYPWSTWDQAYPVTVVSTSTEDVGFVRIQGLDANYNPLTEDVAFVGTTSGTSSNSFIRVNRGDYFNGVNSNAGDITLTANGTTVGFIAIDFGQTMMGIYSVPAGKTAFITAGDFSVQKGEDAQIRFLVREFGENFRIQHLGEAFQNTYRYDFPCPLPIPEKSDLEVRAALVETNNTRVSTNYDLTLVDNVRLKD